MKTFYLDRKSNGEELSGVGKVAEGVIFTDKTVALRWLKWPHSVGFYQSVEDMIFLHGHEGRTTIVFD
jgi:hypothetical protein